MKKYLFALTLLIYHLPLHAEVITDGTLGTATSLPGPNYLIDDSLGQQMGGNLFHSLQTLNLNAAESATFTGPNSIANILTRITGGDSSFIDGTIRSKIPNANLYLLNPNGILFGEHASLDISGSFHASTADAIYLGTTGLYDVRTPANSILTIAPPQAFGFFDDNPISITVQDSFLQVAEGKSLSVIGGDLQFEDATLYAPEGHINLISVASTGKVDFSSDNFEINNFTKLGNITLSLSSPEKMRQIADIPIGNIDTSGQGGGQIFIRGGQLTTNNGFLFSDTYGNKNGQDIDIFIDGPLTL
ncbi:MAG: filamentous hemagglutinin N-terminal domain-containing protein, partial [Candidatus Parabeggiatoa sp.]|nr:filamentous hemagglutinin N-terminal domain-containing protein [Candidatus Parabeggiatoa sp.]